MLSSLYIENIAVIEKVSIDFSNGFQVLTGETGAGKSMIIDAIHALLGHRTSKEIIRTGADYAFVSGIFSIIPSQIKDQLKELSLDSDDEDLIIQRRINTNGKNTCKINGKPATLTILKSIATNLINVHGQHESYQLMSPENHVLYLDSMGKLSKDIGIYQEKLHLLKDCKRKLTSLKSDDSQREKRIDFLKFQIDEIENAQLQPNEYEELTKEKEFYLNKEKITSALNLAVSYLKGDEANLGIIEGLENVSDNLNQIVELLPEVSDLSKRINNSFYELQDCANELLDVISNLDPTPYRLEEIETRLDIIYKLSRKYGDTTEEIFDFLNTSATELKQLEEYETNLSQLENEFDLLYKETKVLAEKLSNKRMQIAKVFTQKVKAEMEFLNMPNIRLEVSREQGPLTENGFDKIEFLISTNPGEPPKPVSKIASGGELSRMMLAIKNVLSDDDIATTLIFDEVDTGISGSAAQKVGIKLKDLSNSKQVICVTHQAQIAALANNHFFISKNIKNSKTYTIVTELDFNQRKEELARIIGGVSVTELTLKHAEEMLLSANNIDFLE